MQPCRACPTPPTRESAAKNFTWPPTLARPHRFRGSSFPPFASRSFRPSPHLRAHCQQIEMLPASTTSFLDRRMTCIKDLLLCLGRGRRRPILLLSRSWKGGSWRSWSFADDDLGWENIPISVRNPTRVASGVE